MDKSFWTKPQPKLALILYVLFVAIRLLFPVMLFNYKPASMMGVEEFRYYRQGKVITEDAWFSYDIRGASIRFSAVEGDTCKDLSTFREIHINDNIGDIANAYAGIPCIVENPKGIRIKYDELASLVDRKHSKGMSGYTRIYYTSYFIKDQPVTIKEYKAACRDKNLKDEDVWRVELRFFLGDGRIVQDIKVHAESKIYNMIN